MKKEVSTKKLVKTIVICAVFAALLAGLIYLMVSDQTYGKPDSLDIGGQNFGARLLIGLQVAFLGLATVFLMLVVLIIAINVIRLILMGVAKLGEKRSAKTSTAVSEVTNAVEEVGEDDEIVAAITAAIMAYYESDKEDCKSNLKFRVRSIKEI
ncbi:MAG: OadG family protein [Clostridia bacterium]|nr:OadG family protein [Clostridia bacterium]MDE7328736.1 OadG family protein [Clostridia bacterium]